MKQTVPRLQQIKKPVAADELLQQEANEVRAERNYK
jgi:hypothetical protein